MPKIIDTPVVESENPFKSDVENLIGAGEGKSLTYDKSDGITDEKSADSLKLKFQRAANSLDRTARAKVGKDENGDITVTFTLRPKQKTRESKPADAAPELTIPDESFVPALDVEKPAAKPRPGK
jgi:hypothetical protein